MKKKTKHKPDAQDALHRAAAKFVEFHGGKLVVTGPIQIIRWPDDKEFMFTLGIRCTGRAPTIKPR